MSGPPVVVFDLDGTLVDSAPGIGHLLNAMRSERGMEPLPLTRYRRWIALGANHLVGNALEVPVHAADSDLVEFRARYACFPSTREDLYPGVGETLGVLSKARVIMGVCSNKPHALCDQVLSGTGIRRYFSAVVGGDSVARVKPDRLPVLVTLERMGVAGHQFFFVGDSVIDAEAAAAAGGIFLWASYGYELSSALAPSGNTLARFGDMLAKVLPGIGT